eukprot:TRINITY_DN995_c0_g4_i2.p1 TRINITY_DN995_c0_g4~~TRINITY_DN995_c0_g4_i2.p1  ORF type:complete len:177 (-),score=41.45 TRINITY_DN995_c0_g4_i2:425-955(-)
MWQLLRDMSANKKGISSNAMEIVLIFLRALEDDLMAEARHEAVTRGDAIISGEDVQAALVGVLPEKLCAAAIKAAREAQDPENVDCAFRLRAVARSLRAWVPLGDDLLIGDDAVRGVAGMLESVGTELLRVCCRDGHHRIEPPHLQHGVTYDKELAAVFEDVWIETDWLSGTIDEL